MKNIQKKLNMQIHGQIQQIKNVKLAVLFTQIANFAQSMEIQLLVLNAT